MYHPVPHPTKSAFQNNILHISCHSKQIHEWACYEVFHFALVEHEAALISLTCYCIIYLQSLLHSNEIKRQFVFLSFIYSSPVITLLTPTGASIWRAHPRMCAAMPVGGPAHALVGERGIVPAATATDISELFIKRMTTLSSPISGPSCTGVLLLLSGRVSSILLPCYSLELLMANTIPPFLPGLSRLAVWNQAWWGGSGR